MTADPGTATIRADELAEAHALYEPELTAEQEFTRALTQEVAYSLEPDGTPVVATEDPVHMGRA